MSLVKKERWEFPGIRCGEALRTEKLTGGIANC
jgi:hypothetical protein